MGSSPCLPPTHSIWLLRASSTDPNIAVVLRIAALRCSDHLSWPATGRAIHGSSEHRSPRRWACTREELSSETQSYPALDESAYTCTQWTKAWIYYSRFSRVNFRVAGDPPGGGIGPARVQKQTGGSALSGPEGARDALSILQSDVTK